MFACVQAGGIWCIYSTSGDHDLKLLFGWWVLLFPGCLAALALPLDYGIPAELAVSVAANAAAWYSVSKLRRFVNKRKSNLGFGSSGYNPYTLGATKPGEKERLNARGTDCRKKQGD
jgi:hypothetical protein